MSCCHILETAYNYFIDIQVAAAVEEIWQKRVNELQIIQNQTSKELNWDKRVPSAKDWLTVLGIYKTENQSVENM